MRLFAKFFVSNGFNRRLAMEAAGYSTSTGWHANAARLLKDPEVSRLIESYQDKELSKFDVSRITENYVLEQMIDLLDRIRTAGIGNWQASAEIKLLEMLGRYRQLFSERVDVNIDVRVVDVLKAARERARLLSVENTRGELSPPVQHTASENVPATQLERVTRSAADGSRDVQQ